MAITWDHVIDYQLRLPQPCPSYNHKACSAVAKRERHILKRTGLRNVSVHSLSKTVTFNDVANDNELSKF